MLKHIQIKFCTNVKYMDQLGIGAYQPFVYTEISPKCKIKKRYNFQGFNHQFFNIWFSMCNQKY
jgi:hypothetical protein